MTTPGKPTNLLPGDCLLYSPNSIIGWVIAIKTWTRVCHCEIYEGESLSVASRDGLGVNRYPLRLANLVQVKRPTGPLNLSAARTWFDTVQGQRYDLWGLLRFFTFKRIPELRNRMFCSEFAVRWYRKAGFNPVDQHLDADCIAPSELYQSVAFQDAWTALGY